MAQNTEKIDKLSLWIIGIIGFMVLFGGVLQIRSHLFIHDRIALAAFEDGNETNDEFLEQSSAAEDLLEQQFEDTDNDGINDAEEQTVYGTSAFLADSDSDGIDDGEEIANGTNPNCPEGTECVQNRSGGDGGVSTDAQAAFSQLNPDAEVLFNADGSVNTDELRRLMVEQGVPEEEVNALTDAELEAVLQQTLNEQQGGAPVETAETGGAEDFAESVLNLTVEEKRELLVQSGLSQEEVDQLSDDQVTELVDETVATTLENPEQTAPDAEEDTEQTNQ